MPINKFSTIVVASCCLAASPHVVQADNDLTVVPKIGFSYKTVELATSGGRKDFAPLFITLDLGMTLAYRSFYVSFSYDSSIKDDVTHNTTPSGSGTPDDSIVYSSRVDGAATIGYNAWRGLTVFGGYKYGESKGLGFADATGSVENFENRLISNGPFLGASYSFRFQDKGSLDLSVAYAIMDGESKYASASTRVVQQGDETGFSYGIAWSGALSETAGYTVGLKANRYTFDADPLSGSTEDPDIDEIHNIFYLAVQKYF